MCWSKDEGVKHRCIATCPLCWIFTESNILKLIAGESLQIGTARDIFDTAVVGNCLFCKSFAQTFLSRRVAKKYTWLSSAKVSIAGVPNDEKERSDLIGLEVTSSNPPIDMWKDEKFRKEHISADPDLDRPGITYEVTESYTITAGLFTKSGRATKYVRPNHASPSVASQEAYGTARNWISECLLSHEKCPGNTVSILPRRVLRVLPSDAKIKLHETNEETGQYTALSYCWGGAPQLMLKTETLETFKQGIEFVSLPETLRDAVLVTRELGIPNLWIDSLCIIQDSEVDMSREISKMADIYKNAVVTISAAIALDCRRGFLEDRENVLSSLQSSYPMPYFPTDEIIGFGDSTWRIYVCHNSEMGYEKDEMLKEATDKRAWTLQESWLSPRMLIYGSGPLEWRCLSKIHVQGKGDKITKPGDFDLKGYVDEGIFRDREKFFKPLTSTDRKLKNWEDWDSNGRYQTLPGWLTDWAGLVKIYTSRQLSYQTDKLLALSGLAAEFHRVTGDNYLAGIWEKSLPWGLLWTRRVSPGEDGNGYAMISYSDEEMQNFWSGTGSTPKLSHTPKDLPPHKKPGKLSKILSKLFDKKKKASSYPEPKHPYALGNSSIIIPPYDIRTRFDLHNAVQQPPELLLKSKSSSYISPSWSFACSDVEIQFEICSWNNLTSKIIIHSASTAPCTNVVPFGKVESGHITLTGPLQRMTLQEVGTRFAICQSSPHLYWDYIIPDRPIGGNSYILDAIMMAGGIPYLENEQFKITEYITEEVFDPKTTCLPESSNLLPTPPTSTADNLIPPNSTMGFWFLKITWTKTPIGLVLVRRSDGLFERFGFFKCARNNWETADWRKRGFQTAGPRGWDWYGGLRMCTITIV